MRIILMQHYPRICPNRCFFVGRETHPDSIKPNITAAQEMHIAENIRDRLLRRTWKVPDMVKTVKQKQPICKGSWDLRLRSQVKTRSSKLEVLSAKKKPLRKKHREASASLSIPIYKVTIQAPSTMRHNKVCFDTVHIDPHQSSCNKKQLHSWTTGYFDQLLSHHFQAQRHDNCKDWTTTGSC